MTDRPEGDPLTEYDRCPDTQALRTQGWKASIYGGTEAATYSRRHPPIYLDIPRQDDTTRETPP